MTFPLSNTDWFTLALVIITAMYAWATFKILCANQAAVNAIREQTEAQLRLYVVSVQEVCDKTVHIRRK